MLALLAAFSPELSEIWQHLIETFSKQFIDFDFTLQQIQTVFGSINNLVTNRF